MKKYYFKVELSNGESTQVFSSLEECKKVYNYYINYGVRGLYSISGIKVLNNDEVVR